MSQPIIKLLYNSTANDVEYDFSAAGEYDGTFYPVISGTCNSTIVFTGGGIEDMASGIYASGIRSATIRPESGSTIVPYTFIEYDDYMYKVPLAGCHNYRYVFAVYIGGSITSKLYLEAWDDMTHTTTNLSVLSGTISNSSTSFIKAKTTTYAYPSDFWTGTALKGYESRIELSNTSSTSNTVLYFNVYVEVPFDSETFVNMPVLSLRYLYS